MAPITGSIEIDRPPQEVFEYSGDPTRLKEWQDAVRDIGVETPGPPAAGTRVRETRQVPGGPRTFTWEYTDYEPPSRWSFQVIDGPIRPRGTMTFSPLDGGQRTRADFQIEFKGHGIGVLFAPLVRRSAPEQVRSDLANLKRRLEADRQPTSAPSGDAPA
ncbi:MAG: hypothetical protein QOC78_2971 [Solirubrobacteraceae bacterium]|jgi:uncharacterized protein YndB with AHSA1/START domain|nr:hypothetical protein [Solirubrobacteraceae bacterium]